MGKPGPLQPDLMMRAIRLTTPGQFDRIELPDIDPGTIGPSDAHVKICHLGVCGTDIHAYHGRQPFFDYPRILGHELGVEVLAVGDKVKNVRPGDRCSVEAYFCEPGDKAYERGKTNCTATTKCLGVHIDGGMRDFMILPADKLQPSTLPTRSLALVEPLCIGHHAVERAGLKGDETCAVIGLGPIGLGVATFASLSGARVVAMDVSEERLAKAREMIPGIRIQLVDPSQPLQQSWQATGLEGPEVVWDCTGNKASMEAAVELPVNGGSIVFVGIYNGELSFSDPDFHRRELSILASRNATARNFQDVIRLMEEGKVNPDQWITHECDADDFAAVFEDWLSPGSGLLKGVIQFKG
jgi:2-desacetyl-2-hydroxyethyl bacteriochlorophyllide A dehydrogenase